MKKIIIITIAFFTIIGFLFVKFVLIPELSNEQITKKYTVDNIYSPSEGVNDIVFRAKENGQLMYINRGLEEFSLDYFKSHILNKPALFTISYNKSNKVNRITKIEHNGTVIYNY